MKHILYQILFFCTLTVFEVRKQKGANALELLGRAYISELAGGGVSELSACFYSQVPHLCITVQETNEIIWLL
jgi:hypothetical protein